MSFTDFVHNNELLVTVIIAVSLLLVALVLWMIRGVRLQTRTLIVGALCIAMSFVLSYLRLYRMPQGGSITIASMLPVMIFAWLYGPAAEFLASFCYGLLQLIQDMYIVHPAQLLLDYILAFSALGLVAFFKKNYIPGIIVAGFARFLMHYLAGIVFYASFAPEGQSPLLYSLVYNGSVVGPDLLICLIIASMPAVKRMLINYKQRIKPPAQA